MWNPEHYQKAMLFAGIAHADQHFPGTEAAYVVHLAQVAMEIQYAWTLAPGDWNVDLALQCALLHDSLEDTPTPYASLEATFGPEVAQGVQALSKNPHLPKAEQMNDSLQRIKTQPKEIAMVKLADRITNLQSPPPHWDSAKIAKYQAEARLIHDELGFANAFLAQRLMAKIEAYTDFLNR
ncbi:MAG: HD domain-containing protein [Candidatus Sericytochromatia bacterium]